MNNGSIDITPSGGVGVFSYSWSHGPTSQDVGSLGPGTYVLTLTDALGCSVTETFIIPGDNPPLTLTGQTSDNLCFGDQEGSIVLNINGGLPPYMYEWTDGSNDGDRDNLSAGTYTVTVTDDEGFFISETFIIEEGNEIIVQTFITNAGTDPGSVEIIVGGANSDYTIEWSNGASDFNLCCLNPGTYTALITENATQCSTSIEIEIIYDSSIPGIALVEIQDVNCFDGNDGSIEIIANGAAPVEVNWSNGATGTLITNLEAGMYTATILDANGESLSETYNVNQPGAALIIEYTATPSFQNEDNGSISTEVSGGTEPYMYQWNTGSSTNDLDNLAPGIYMLTLTDANECSETIEILIEQAEEVDVIVTTSNISCNGLTDGSVEFIPVGNVDIASIIWFADNGLSGTSLQNLEAANYDYIIADSDGNVIFDGSFTIEEPEAIVLEIESSFGFAETASASVTNLTGGTPPYNYFWTNGSDQSATTGFNEGQNLLTVTDDSGCIKEAPFEVYANGFEVINNICFGDMQGEILAVINDGEAYQFDWSTGETGQSINDLSNGLYNVTVTDQQSQEFFFEFEVNSPEELMVMGDIINAADNGSSINLSISGGVEPYFVGWQEISSNSSFVENLAPGTYNVIITDASNCTISAAYEVTEPIVSVNDLQSDELYIYPNPAVNFVWLEGFKSAVQLEIIDLNGKILLQRTVSQSYIDISTIAPGIYFLKIEDEDQIHIEKLLIEE